MFHSRQWYIRFPAGEGTDEFELRLINPSGQSFGCRYTWEQGRIRLETGSLPAGIYFATISGFESGELYRAILIRR